jgi:hypothetical protein
LRTGIDEHYFAGAESDLLLLLFRADDLEPAIIRLVLDITGATEFGFQRAGRGLGESVGGRVLRRPRDAGRGLSFGRINAKRKANKKAANRRGREKCLRVVHGTSPDFIWEEYDGK